MVQIRKDNTPGGEMRPIIIELHIRHRNKIKGHQNLAPEPLVSPSQTAIHVKCPMVHDI